MFEYEFDFVITTNFDNEYEIHGIEADNLPDAANVALEFFHDEYVLQPEERAVSVEMIHMKKIKIKDVFK